jgi:hypothetical protein
MLVWWWVPRLLSGLLPGLLSGLLPGLLSGLLSGLLRSGVGQVDPWQVLRRLAWFVLRGVGLVHEVLLGPLGLLGRSVRDADQVPHRARRPP